MLSGFRQWGQIEGFYVVFIAIFVPAIASISHQYTVTFSWWLKSFELCQIMQTQSRYTSDSMMATRKFKKPDSSVTAPVLNLYVYNFSPYANHG